MNISKLPYPTLLRYVDCVQERIVRLTLKSNRTHAEQIALIGSKRELALYQQAIMQHEIEAGKGVAS